MEDKKKILIVEDESIIAMDIESMLKDIYQVIGIAHSGERCLRLIKTNEPDLVLMDIRLKGSLNGLQTAEFIKKNYDIPIIFLTAYSNETYINQAKESEPYAYIIKPITRRDLHSSIQISLYKHKTDKNLREKTRLNQLLLDALPHITLLIKPKTYEIITVNKAGIEAGARPGQKCYDTLGASIENSTGPCARCLASKAWETNQNQQCVVERSEKVWESYWIPIDSNMYIHYLVDITEKRLAENALRESEERYRAIVENASDSIFMINRNFQVLSVNSAARSFLRKDSHEKIIGQPIFNLFPEETAKKFRASLEKTFDTGNSSITETKFTFMNRDIWINTNLNPIKNEKGEVTAILGLTRDITARMESEIIIRENEERLRLLFDSTHDLIRICDVNNVTRWANPAWIEIYGPVEKYKPEPFARVHPEDREKCMKLWSELITDNKEIKNIEFRYLNTNNEFMTFESSAFKMNAGDEKLYYVVNHDITERKRTEREKEILLQSIRQRMKELNCLYRLSKIIEQSDVSLDEIFSSTTEIMRDSWQYPEITRVKITFNGNEYASSDLNDLKETVWKQSCDIRVHKEIKGKIEVYYMEKMPERDEGPFLIEERHLLNALAEQLRRIIERYDALRDLEKSREELKNLSSHLQTVREEERRGIAREIHDELGQALTAIKMDMAWIVKRLSHDNFEILDKINALSSIIDNTINTVRRISSNLRPGILDDIGLLAAIEWQSEEIQNKTEIRCKIIADSNSYELTEQQKITIFRIFQEAMTNIVRHSNALKVKIKLYNENLDFVLEISDNGKGITEEEINNTKSFGLIGMRERTEFCNGTIEIKGNKGKGTTIKLKIPVI